MKEKYYNIELIKKDAEILKEYLHTNKIYFESSGCGNLIHFEIKLNKVQLEKANNFINTL